MEDGESGFVDEGGGGVPGLDLLTDDEVDFGGEGGVGGDDFGDDVVVEMVEEFW